MRYPAFGIVVGVLWFAAPAIAENRAFVEKCEDWRGQRFPVEERIDGCTATIAAKIYQGKDLARVYDNRGIGWSDKGDFDRAVADYGQAIELDPDDARAHNNRGNAFKNMGERDRAIADFDQAIKLVPTYALAYFNRGLVFDDKGDFDRALADYDKAIEFNPGYAKAYNNRGLIWEAKGDLNRAIADLDRAIVAGPKNFQPYFARGRIEFYVGAPERAAADLKQSTELNPDDAYAALWLDIVNKRGKRASHLAEAAKAIDMASWPAPVIRFYLGQSTAEATLAAADDPDAETRRGRLCEANFYVGEAALLRGDQQEARRLFRLAVAGCDKGFIEHASARAELSALDAHP